MGEIFQINIKNLTLELEMPLKYINCVHDAFANMVESAHNYSLLRSFFKSKYITV